MGFHRLRVLAAALLFATTGTAQALGAADASPIAVGVARVTVGALGLRLAVLWAHPPLRDQGTRASSAAPSGPALWLAGLAVALYQPAFFLAVRSSGVAVGTTVALGCAPVLTAALAWACGGGRPGRHWAAGTALAALGLGVLALPGPGASGAGSPALAGILLALVAGASYAVYTVTLERVLAGGADATATMAGVFGRAAVLLAPLLLAVPFGWAATPLGAATALWLGLVPTAAAYLLFARGLSALPAAEVSTLTLAEPVTASLLGIMILGEPITPSGLGGATLILVALAVLACGRPGPREAADHPRQVSRDAGRDEGVLR